MTKHDPSNPLERTVHGMSPDGGELVRYDRAGKWRIEYSDGSSRAIGLGEAVTLATAPGGRVFPGRYGGKLFNARINAATGSNK